VTDATPQPVFLADYRPYSHLVDGVELTFRLAPKATRVQARLHLRPNPSARGHHVLRLDGEGLRLISLRLDGALIDVTPDATGLTIPGAHLPDAPFTLETEVEIAPEGNTALEGLYMSRGLYCTQCEAEGFRKITYYPDRPDVMAPSRCGSKATCRCCCRTAIRRAMAPAGPNGMTPGPSPPICSPLVAGDLVAHRDVFTTRSGRKVDLAVWVRPGDQDRCAYAMDSLIRSMKWDEEVYGREYDLDVFNIVAVDDFNMGAMENKGLNIFNSKLVLAIPRDGDRRRLRPDRGGDRA
jgi:aminopeptidase N